MATITNYVLKQQLKNIQSNNKPTLRSGGLGSSTNTDDEIEVSIDTKQFHRISNYGKTILFNDNTTAPLLSPIPCVVWKSKNKEDSGGTATIGKDLSATVLKLGDKQVVIGFDPTLCGTATDLEYLIDLGDTEVYLTNEFLSIKSKTIVKNGVEIE
jgi:hypothetical protein